MLINFPISLLYCRAVEAQITDSFDHLLEAVIVVSLSYESRRALWNLSVLEDFKIFPLLLHRRDARCFANSLENRRREQKMPNLKCRTRDWADVSFKMQQFNASGCWPVQNETRRHEHDLWWLFFLRDTRRPLPISCPAYWFFFRIFHLLSIGNEQDAEVNET